MTEGTTTDPISLPAKALKAVFSALASQTDTVRVDPQEDGWHLYGRGTSGTSLVNIHIPAGAFIGDYSQWAPFGMIVEKMLSLLSKASGAVTLDISKGYMAVTSGRVCTRGPILPDFEQYPRLPQGMETDLEVGLSVDIVNEVVQAVSDKEARHRGITFDVSGDRLELESYADDDPVNGVVVTVPRADCAILAGEGSARYSHKLMMEIFSTVPKGTDVDMQYAEDYLMMITYTVEGALITFVVAPWVEQE